MMSYCTYYSLTLVNAAGDDMDRVVERLKELDVIGYALTEDLNSFDNVAWSQHDLDMLELSLEFPHVRFDLLGSGEDCDDLWETHYQNGKMQKCLAVIPPYAPNKMEKPSALLKTVKARVMAKQAAKAFEMEESNYGS